MHDGNSFLEIERKKRSKGVNFNDFFNVWSGALRGRCGFVYLSKTYLGIFRADGFYS